MTAIQIEEGLFARLPKSEAEFILKEAISVTRPLNAKKLEDLLFAVAKVFENKEYGWEEAILDGKWFRYPSEVKRTRFCSEEALKNYLILRTLRIPAIYVIGETFYGGRLAHEVVVAADKERLLMIDWDEVMPVEIRGQSLFKIDKQLLSKKIHLAGDKEVIERVESLRSGERFMNAITSGQMLYRKESAEGECEAFIRYYPNKKVVEFEFIMTDVVDFLPFYFIYGMQPRGGMLKIHQECGIALNKNRDTYDKLRIASIGLTDNDKLPLPFIDKLNEWDQTEVYNAVLYDKFLADYPKKRLATTQEERRKLVERLRISSEDNNQNNRVKSISGYILQLYKDLKEKYSNAAAERYLDSRTFMFSCLQYEGGLQKLIEEKTTLKVPEGVELIYLILQIGNMVRFVSANDTLRAQDRLAEVLAEKTDLPYESVSRGILSVIDWWGRRTRGDVWETRMKYE